MLLSAALEHVTPYYLILLVLTQLITRRAFLYLFDKSHRELLRSSRALIYVMTRMALLVVRDRGLSVRRVKLILLNLLVLDVSINWLDIDFILVMDKIQKYNF